MVKILVSEGADLNRQDQKGLTSLMWGVRSGNLKLVRYLLRQGAKLNIKDKRGYTALNWSQIIENKAIKSYLKKQGAEYGATQNPDFSLDDKD